MTRLKFLIIYISVIFIVSGCSTQLTETSYVQCNPPSKRIIHSLQSCSAKLPHQHKTEVDNWLTVQLIRHKQCLRRQPKDIKTEIRKTLEEKARSLNFSTPAVKGN